MSTSKYRGSNRRKVLTLVEDKAHNKFLELCKTALIDSINSTCQYELDFEPRDCCGKNNLVCNVLPSLLTAYERFLVTLDLDICDGVELFKWVKEALDGSKTKAGWSIKVDSATGNLFKVLVNGNARQIVVLPLGLSTLSGKIKSHSVEDYVLESYSAHISSTKGNTSKEILNSIIESQGLSQSAIDTGMNSGIKKYSSQLTNYLEPLWTTSF